MNGFTAYTSEQLKDFHESKLILVIHGGVYDLTEFANAHPGGPEILTRYNRKDASKAFDAVKHSANAKAQFHKYLLGYLEDHEQEFHQSIKLQSHPQDSFFKNLKKKLFTHEDYFHIHKILGSLVVGHFIVRMGILFAGTAIFLLYGEREVFDWNGSYEPAWLLILLALLHGALSLSSLQFNVPRKSSQSLPMIHALFRAHSIIFALRAVACMILYVLLRNYPEIRMLTISLVVIATLVIADIISTQLTEKDDRFDTTSSMPYWFGVDPERQQIHKYLYGYGQYLATLVCLLTGYSATLYTLAPIQGAAFGMTLVRKNLISPKLHHNVYLALLYLPIPFVFFFYPLRVVGILVLTWFFYELRRKGVNKYLIWVPFVIGLNIYLIPYQWWPIFICSLALSSGLAVLYNLHQVRTSGQERIDKNNRLIETKHINNYCTELKIRTKVKMDLKTGQHILIRLTQDIERKYTPIWSEYLEQTDQSLLSLRIRQYPENKNKEGPSASHLLKQLPQQSILDVSGPIGEKYYCNERNSIIDLEDEISLNSNQKEIYLLSASSGITPLFQIAQNLCALGEKFTLISCDKSPEHMLLHNELSELKTKYPKQVQWHTFFSLKTTIAIEFKEADFCYDKRIDSGSLLNIINQDARKEKVIIFCGPNEWENFIRDSLSGKQNTTMIAW